MKAEFRLAAQVSQWEDLYMLARRYHCQQGFWESSCGSGSSLPNMSSFPHHKYHILKKPNGICKSIISVYLLLPVC